MRKMNLITLMGVLCLWMAVPGTASANHQLPAQTVVLDQGEMDPVLLHSILVNVQAEWDIDLAVLANLYDNGDLTIVATEEGYLVTLRDGGVIISILTDRL